MDEGRDEHALAALELRLADRTIRTSQAELHLVASMLENAPNLQRFLRAVVRLERLVYTLICWPAGTRPSPWSERFP